MKPAEIILRIKPFLVAIICVVFAAGCFIYASTRAGIIMDLEAEQATLGRQITLIDSNTRSAANLADQVNRLEAALETVDGKLFNPDARAVNTNFFYQLEHNSDVRIVQARQSGVNTGGNNATFSRIDFALTVEGTFEALLDFIYRLQELDAFIAPGNVALQAGGAGGRGRAAGRQMTMSINVRVLGQK